MSGARISLRNLGVLRTLTTLIPPGRVRPGPEAEVCPVPEVEVCLLLGRVLLASNPLRLPRPLRCGLGPGAWWCRP